MDSSVKVNLPVMIALDRIHANAWNPNEQTDETFNQLVEEIREDGFDHPLQVCPCSCEQIAGDHYRIIGGEHRYKAATVLDMKEVPCTIYEKWDEFTQKIKTVRRNLLSGDLNDRKFTDLIESLKDNGVVSDEELWQRLGFDTQESYLKHIINLASEEDKKKDTWLQSMMDQSNQEVDAVDSMSDVLNHIFSQYGDTVPQSFLFFAYKGRTHLMVLMSKELNATIEKTVEEVKASKINMNDHLLAKLGGSDGKPKSE